MAMIATLVLSSFEVVQMPRKKWKKIFTYGWWRRSPYVAIDFAVDTNPVSKDFTGWSTALPACDRPRLKSEYQDGATFLQDKWRTGICPSARA
jgi:hypothetical protein